MEDRIIGWLLVVTLVLDALIAISALITGKSMSFRGIDLFCKAISYLLFAAWVYKRIP